MNRSQLLSSRGFPRHSSPCTKSVQGGVEHTSSIAKISDAWPLTAFCGNLSILSYCYLFRDGSN